ncbi:MAG TPA: threonine ammonia-lyase [Alphaproteobacteria bacterium]|nr:threonine ammonia-lyase [Alphaproteobacteria bacterium]
MTVTLDTVRKAQRLIEGAVSRTPFEHSRTLSRLCGAEIFLKFENLQYTASFKERGALVKLLSLTDAQRRAGVVAASAGNHAQGVAYHAERLGIPATIVMPVHTPFTKVVRTRDFGATVVLHGEGVAEAKQHALELGARGGLAFVHPYDDEKIIAGQGTVAIEMLDRVPDLDVLVVPVGGGGLIAGCAVAAKALRPQIRVFGVEASLFPSMDCALRGVAPVAGGPTIAEGIAVKEPGTLTLPIIRDLVERIFLVDEAALERAVQLILEIEKTVAEGAGAASLAALLANPDAFRGRRVGLVVSGGNIDSRLLASVLMRGLARDGRIARIRVEITDAPGTLARVAGLIAEAGGNIVEIYHQRLFADVPVKRADLDAVIETRDAAHLAEIMARLRQAGLAVRQLGNTAADGP